MTVGPSYPGKPEVEAPLNTPKIRLLIFSGRPDPEWVVEQKEAAAVRELLVGLDERTNPPPPAGLGYKGFLVQLARETSELPTEIHVFRGVVTANPGSRARHLRDTTGLETWLLEDARRRGWGEVLDVAGAHDDG